MNQPISTNQKPLRRATRVLFVDHTAQLGGGEIALLNLITALDTSRFQPIVVLFSDGPLVGRLRQTGCEVHLLPLSSAVVDTRKDSLGMATLLRIPILFASLALIWRLRRFIRANKIDLVHTNSLKADILGGLASRWAGVPLIWHIRDRISNDYLPSQVVAVFRWLCRWFPDYVITNSAATLETTSVKQSQRSSAIPSGIDLRSLVVHDGLRPQHDHPGVASGNGESERLVGLVGRISPWKGQHVFLRAAAEVHRKFPEVRFQIIGSAMFNEHAYEQRIRQLTKDLSLNDCVEFTGFRDDIPLMISRMEILVHASTTPEPFGQVVAEGMAAGKPVVATAGGGVLEVVQDGITGFLVPVQDAEAMGNAICRLLADPEAARHMGEKGRQRVLENFTIASTVSKIQQVYDVVLSSRHPAQRLESLQPSPSPLA
jgi:glycosyltransferase involved in cell wall biosynthesis